MNFVFFSTALWDWGDGVQPGPQLSRELARRGNPVVFIQPQPPSKVNLSGLPIKLLSLRDLGLAENLVVRAGYGLDVGSLEQVGECLLATLRDTLPSNQPQIAMWFAPFAPFARLLPLLQACGYRLIYYPQDDFADMVRLGFYRHNLAAEEYLGRECEMFVTLSWPVAKKMERFGKRVQVIADGINLDEFRAGEKVVQAPRNVVRGERTLGFWGWLDEAMVDLEQIKYVARVRPTWAINLIGGPSSEMGHRSLAEELKDFHNVYFQGEVSHRELAAFGSCFDACLIPAPDNDFSRGRDPIKVYEYLALYKPVICTHMPQLAGMPYVRNASTPQEFLQEIETALVTPVDAQALDDFLAKQTWAARVDALLDVVRSLGEREPAGAPPHVPENAAGSLVAASFAQDRPGAQAYLSELETDLAETRRWAGDLEAAALAKDRELKRIYDFLPIRILRWLVHLFA